MKKIDSIDQDVYKEWLIKWSDKYHNNGDNRKKQEHTRTKGG